jgi:broad specificity phosphatase PhoE
MKRKSAVLVGLLIVLVCLPAFWGYWWRCGQPATTLLIVRHADRQGSADALSDLGVQRAQELIHVGERAGVVAIYRSNTIRARDTAAPLASALGLTPVEYVAGETGPLAASILADHRGESVLVVGHSNTVPQIIAAAGGPAVADIPDTEFDNLFVLTVCRCRRGPATLVNLQYGAPSP